MYAMTANNIFTLLFIVEKQRKWAKIRASFALLICLQHFLSSFLCIRIDKASLRKLLIFVERHNSQPFFESMCCILTFDPAKHAIPK